MILGLRIGAVTLIACAAGAAEKPGAMPVIPLPREIQASGPSVPVPPVVALTLPPDPGLDPIAGHYQRWLKSRGIQTDARAPFNLDLALDASAGGSPESYTISVKFSGIIVRAPGPAGLFYALQTIKHMTLSSPPDAPALLLPEATVRDAPEYRWRGMHLDVSRHFFDKAFLFRYLDHLAEYKMNVFHWHLTDGPGWRLEIPDYPRLTAVGAWRRDQRDQTWNWRATVIHPEGRQPGDYGGFYTGDDVREIVRYAAERFIMVVPEIEMPGHSYAALVAYPEFACEGTDILRDGLRGRDAFCIGHPGLESFLTGILDAVTEMFPSPWIHIGGDEVAHEAWRQCPRCRALMEREGMTSPTELQGHLIRRMEKHLQSRGRRLVGWDEIAGDGLTTNAAVMVWREPERAMAALERGMSVVLSPNRHCYFDYYQGPPEHEPPAIGGRVTLRDVYAFSPASPDLSPNLRARVLGGQGNVWTEYLQTPAAVEYMIFPRMPALAETLWSDPARRDWTDFMSRLRAHRSGWDARGIRYRAASFDE